DKGLHWRLTHCQPLVARRTTSTFVAWDRLARRWRFVKRYEDPEAARREMAVLRALPRGLPARGPERPVREGTSGAAPGQGPALAGPGNQYGPPRRPRGPLWDICAPPCCLAGTPRLKRSPLGRGHRPLPLRRRAGHPALRCVGADGA